MSDNNGNPRRSSEPKSPSNGQNLVLYLVLVGIGTLAATMFFVNSGVHELSFYDFLRIHNVGFCNIDQPVIGQSLRPDDRVTAPPGYIRLHGRNYADWFREGAGRDARYNYLYSREEVRQLSGSIRKIGQTTEETYAVTNNHFRGQALVNALEIVEELGGAAPAVPPLLKAAYPGRF